MKDWIAALGWVDMTMLVVLAVSMVVGLVRGFVFECLSLAGWLVAWFAAQWAAPQLAPHVPVGVPGSGLNLGVAFVLDEAPGIRLVTRIVDCLFEVLRCDMALELCFRTLVPRGRAEFHAPVFRPRDPALRAVASD